MIERGQSKGDRMNLEKKIASSEALVGIIGMGYVGLPLGLTFAENGFKVVGFDIDPAKVETLNAGRSYIKHIPPARVTKSRSEGRFEATADYSRLELCDAIIICVPTPLTEHKEPDLSYIVNSVREVAKYMRKGQLVVLESTTYPGTTDEVVKPMLENRMLKCGKDFFLAFSPEREDPGNPNFDTATIPKVVGGVDVESGRLAVLLYSKVIKTIVPVKSAREAEACKILENIYRSVNIALVNELKMIFDKMGIDVWDVIEAAKTKPFGFHAFYPGPGLGGHCIPIDPFYLSWKAREFDSWARFIELAGEINTGMPAYVVNRLAEALNEHGKPVKDSKILVLGISYKSDVDDLRESPSLVIVEQLLEKGADVSYNDPFFPSIPRTRHHNLTVPSVELNPLTLASFDAVVVATAHSSYDMNFICEHAQLVIDTRNATRNVKNCKAIIVRA